jgi:hypothetical protein
MKKWDAAFLAVVLLLSALGFLLPLRENSWHGVALFGWWMAGLMLLGPAAAYWHMRKEPKR